MKLDPNSTMASNAPKVPNATSLALLDPELVVPLPLLPHVSPHHFLSMLPPVVLSPAKTDAIILARIVSIASHRLRSSGRSKYGAHALRGSLFCECSWRRSSFHQCSLLQRACRCSQRRSRPPENTTARTLPSPPSLQ